MPDAPTPLQAAIVAEIERQGITPYALAVQLGWSPPHIYRRLRNPSTTADRISEMAAALGMELRPSRPR